MRTQSRLLIALFLFASAVAPALEERGDDTPFLLFQCSFGRVETKKLFLLKFHNDDSHEARLWKSEDWKGSSIRFEKTNSVVATVSVTTGFPVVGLAAPEAYRFTAPLKGGRFEFTFVQKLAGMAPEPMALICTEQL